MHCIPTPTAMPGGTIFLPLPITASVIKSLHWNISERLSPWSRTTGSIWMRWRLFSTEAPPTGGKPAISAGLHGAALLWHHCVCAISCSYSAAEAAAVVNPFFSQYLIIATTCSQSLKTGGFLFENFYLELIIYRVFHMEFSSQLQRPQASPDSLDAMACASAK